MKSRALPDGRIEHTVESLADVIAAGVTVAQVDASLSRLLASGRVPRLPVLRRYAELRRIVGAGGTADAR